MSLRKWSDWYRDGQIDVLAWLRGVPDVEGPMAPICEELDLEFSLWCLAHNLAIAAAMTEAAERARHGCSRAAFEAMGNGAG